MTSENHVPDKLKAFENQTWQTTVSPAVNEDDRRKFFELFYKVHGETENLPENVSMQVKHFQILAPAFLDKSERRVFVIHDQNQNVIAGAELVLGEKTGRKEAYFGRKVVDHPYRERGFGQALTKERLRVAMENDCAEAWTLVEQDNITALRSINRNNFYIVGNGMKKTGEAALRDSYYMSRDLTQEPPQPLQADQIEHTSRAENSETLNNDRVLISADNPDLIHQALAKGFIGRQVIIPKDAKNIQHPMILMEKMQTKTEAK